jgi:hypothetical protein
MPLAACRHAPAHRISLLTAGQEGGLLPPPPRAGPPAREYPFPLDPFQQTAVNALEAGHSVLVAAHTSAGKTVVAEYAFGMALRDGSKVVYTSPLKVCLAAPYAVHAVGGYLKHGSQLRLLSEAGRLPVCTWKGCLDVSKHTCSQT